MCLSSFMHNRRYFITISAATAASAFGFGCSRDPKDVVLATIPAEVDLFPRSMSTASRSELDTPLQVISGTLPRDILGHAFIIGSVPMSADGPQVVGDGIIYRISFDSDDALLTTRLVRTDCFLLDEATKEDETLGFKDHTFIRSSQAFGVRNFSNTAFQPIQDGRLLVTYDAGRAWEIDPQTLEVITPVGLLEHWHPFLPAATPGLNFFPLSMTSAHPAFDAQEKLTYFVNFAAPVEGLNTEPFTRILWWDGDSEPKSCKLIDQDGQPVAIEMACHQMTVTDHYLVIFDTAFNLEVETFFGTEFVTRPAQPYTAMWIIRKDDLVTDGETIAQRAVVPTEGAHAISLRSDRDDVIDIFIAHQNSFDPSEWIGPDDVVVNTGEPINPDHIGILVQPADRSLLGRYKINAITGEILESQTFQDPESWAFVLFAQDPRKSDDRFGDMYWTTFGYDPVLLTERYLEAYAMHPDRQVAIQDLPDKRLPNQLIRFDGDEFKVVDRFVMPLGYICLSPTFIPRQDGAVDDGYILVFVVSDEGDELWIFKSQNLSQGPLCRLGHQDLDFAFTLHTAWMPEIKEMTSPTYVVDKTEDYRDRITGLSPEAQTIAKEILGIEE